MATTGVHSSVCFTTHSLAELPECREKIVHSPGLLNQMVSATLSPSYTPICAEIVLSALLCLSYSRDLHRHLATPYILNGVLEACDLFTKELEKFRESPNATNKIDRKDLLLIK